MEDRELIRRVQSGQKEYLNEIAEKYYDDIYYFCCYQSGDRENAYDLAQETFMRFIRYVGQYKYRNLKGYLLTIAMNVCRNYYSEKNLAGNTAELGEETFMPDGKGTRADGIDQKEYSLVLKEALRKIPEEQREAVLLHHFYGYKNREIARMTGVSCAAVKSRINLGLSRLAKLLREEEFYG